MRASSSADTSPRARSSPDDVTLPSPSGPTVVTIVVDDDSSPTEEGIVTRVRMTIVPIRIPKKNVFWVHIPTHLASDFPHHLRVVPSLAGAHRSEEASRDGRDDRGETTTAAVLSQKRASSRGSIRAGPGAPAPTSTGRWHDRRSATGHVRVRSCHAMDLACPWTDLRAGRVGSMLDLLPLGPWRRW